MVETNKQLLDIPEVTYMCVKADKSDGQKKNFSIVYVIVWSGTLFAEFFYSFVYIAM